MRSGFANIILALGIAAVAVWLLLSIPRFIGDDFGSRMASLLSAFGLRREPAAGVPAPPRPGIVEGIVYINGTPCGAPCRTSQITVDRIIFMSADGAHAASVNIGPGGAYRTELPAGSYRAVAGAEQIPGAAAAVSVQAGQSVRQDFRLTLTPF